MKISDHTKGFSAVILSAIAQALGSSVLSRLIHSEMPLFFQGLSRVFFCAVIMFLWLLFFKGLRFKLLAGDIKWFVGRSFGGLIGFLFFYIPINNLAIGITYFSYFAGTLLSGYLFAWLLFKEKVTKQEIIFMGFALVGLLLVYSQFNLFEFNGYVTLAFFGGMGYTIWASFTKKLKGSYSNVQIGLIDFITVGIMYAVGSLISGEVWTLPVISAGWLASFGLGIIWIFSGIATVYGFRRISASFGSLLLLVEVPISVFIGGVFYKENISLLSWLGGVLILFASVMPEVNMLPKKNHEKA